MKLHHNYFVYIVECKDHFYYTGVTNDLEHNRLWEHNTGFNKKCFTFKRRPVELKYYQRFTNIHQAIEWEKQLKGCSRKKKEALFAENWELIQQLAKSSTPKRNSGNPSTGWRQQPSKKNSILLV